MKVLDFKNIFNTKTFDDEDDAELYIQVDGKDRQKVKKE